MRLTESTRPATPISGRRAGHGGKRGGGKSVIVIGAGPGGLASAMLLAAAGMEVTVLERRHCVGGRTSALEADGFRFDTGPTFFLYPRVLEEIYSACGLDLHDEVEMVRLDPQYRISFAGGGHIDATPDLARMEAQVASIAPGDAAAVGDFLADNRVKLEEFRPILENPFESWRDLATPAMAKLLPMVAPWRSLDGELKRYFSDERVRLAFSFQSKYLGMSPFRCPSLFSILSFLEYEFGVFHPIGGCAAVSEAMARSARRLGVEILLDTAVEEVLFEGRRAVGVRAGGRTHRADSVVVNADFARAMEKLVPNHLRSRWSDEKIADKKFSCSTFMLYLGLDGRYDDMPHHNIHIAHDYRRNLDEIENRHVLSDAPSVYVQNPGVTDPTLAPDGQSTLYVLVPVTHQHDNVDWQRDAGPFRKRVLGRLEEMGFSGLEQRIRYEKVVTPDDWSNEFQVYRGATFNLAHNLRQMLHLRPRNRFDELDGVYLVGGGTHPGSGLPVIFESARISSRLLLEDLGLEFPDVKAGEAAVAPLVAARAAARDADRVPDRLRQAV